MPLLWWVDLCLCLVLVGEAVWRRAEAWTRPAIAVYGTIAVWYLGDYLYSKPGVYEELFSQEVLDTALLQVGGFFLAYRILLGLTAAEFDRKDDRPLEFDPVVLTRVLAVALPVWGGLFLLGLYIAEWRLMAIVWPPSAGVKIGMFAHPGVGGSTGYLVATAGYIYLALCALFGIAFALSNGSTRWLLGTMMAMSWPYFLFDRARNGMLALMVPGILAYLLLRRGPLAKRVAITIVIFFAINSWFLFVLESRNLEGGIANQASERLQAFLAPPRAEEGYSSEEEVRHEGLDMLKELCFINEFIDSETIVPNHGFRYVVELLNVVPRAFWPEKPMVGIDYAIARGFGGASYGAGVFATVSTGTIGQGLVNFGQVYGVVAAAALMAMWSALLARLWQQRMIITRALLFVLGLGLTFNMGRDITLLVLWPFAFAYLGVRIYEQYHHVEVSVPQSCQFDATPSHR